MTTSKCSRASLNEIAVRIIVVLFVLTAASFVFAETPLQQFRNYLEAPPTVSRIVFKRSALSHVPGINDEKPVLYCATWQSGSFLLRDFSDGKYHDLYESAKSELIICQHKDSGWCVENGWLKTTSNLKANNDVTVTLGFAKRILAQAIVVGSPNIVIGSVRWIDDEKFNATTFNGQNVEGHIAGIANGLPSGIAYNFNTGSGQLRFMLSFDYDKAISSYLPTKITTYRIDPQDKKTPLSELKIIQLVFTNAPVADSYYESSRFYDANKKPTIEYTINNASYLKEGHRTTKMLKAEPILMRDSQSKTARIVTIGSLIIVTIGMVCFGFRELLKNKHQKHQ